MNDTRFLLQLAKILEEEIARLGRQEWLHQSLERMLHAAGNPKEKDRTKAWRIAGSAVLSPAAQAVLRALWHWRDNEAREWNRPAFHVMSNEELLKIADLSVKGAPLVLSRLPQARRQRLEQALDAALRIPEEEWPLREKSIRPRPNKPALKEFERLKNLRNEIGKREKLNPSLIASKAALEAIAFQNDFSNLMEWQKQLLYGKPQ